MSDITLQRARTHLGEDPDPSHRQELVEILEQAEAGDDAALADLESRFASGLTFGTAGLRGALGPGTARMNRVVVLKACFGFGRYLLAQQLLNQVDDVKDRGVVIAFDGRRYSRQFAEDTAAVLAGLGIKAHLFDDPVPTPMAAFAVTHLGAAGGVMVTASHNPPSDNGYKVYWENGAQIIPPHDAGIAACIAEAPLALQIERLSPAAAAAAGLRVHVSDDVEAAYLRGIDDGCLHPFAGKDGPKIVYTAMHGVGHRLTVRALRRAGFNGVAVVPEQTDPDGTFPTVAFPNPEEPGALDRAFALADDQGADLVLAQDPDADRLAVALRPKGGGPKTGADKTGEQFVRLSGNAVGVLLGADAIEHTDTGADKKLVCTSLVSSTMLSRIAADLGAEYEETLTGFKWIAGAALRREAEGGVQFVLGYEEALGYSCGPLVRDKDGVSAVVRLAELAAFLETQGSNLLVRLDDLAVKHGLSEDMQWSVVLPGADGQAKIEAAMVALRKNPPQSLGGEPISRTRDLVAADPPANVLSFWTESGLRFTARPSGTEPKIKFYLDATQPVKAKAELEAARTSLRTKLQAIRTEVMATLPL